MKVPLYLLLLALLTVPAFPAADADVEALRAKVDAARDEVGKALVAMRALHAELSADFDLLRSEDWPLVNGPYLDAVRAQMKTGAAVEEPFLAAALLTPWTTRRMAAAVPALCRAVPHGEGPAEVRVLSAAARQALPGKTFAKCWDEAARDHPVVVAWREANQRFTKAEKALEVARTAPAGDADAPPGMVLVERGRFRFGPWEGWRFDLESNKEKRVSLDGFFIDVHEVTNQQFHGFLSKVGDPEKVKAWLPHGFTIGEDGTIALAEGTARQPVRGLPFVAARAYAKSLGKRLPTEEEWEKAARGPKGLLYPWGKEFLPEATNWRGRKLGRPADVGASEGDVSPYGVRDMAGNVSEMTATLAERKPLGDELKPSDFLIYRGGSYDDGEDAVKAVYRWTMPATKPSPEKVGFRCAMTEEDWKKK